MAEMETFSQEDFYQRRLDRTPDGKEFMKLPQEDRRLVGHLRNAVDGVHSKVTALKDEVEEKERGISREQALRKAAENRLEQLVDMYGDPKVNEELRERLPRSNREDVVQQLEIELNSMNTGKHRGRSVSFDDIQGETSTGAKGSKSKRNKSADGRHRRHKHNTTASEDESEFDSGEEVEHRNHHRSRDRHYPAGYPPYPPMAYMPPYNYYMPPPPPMYQNMMPGQQQLFHGGQMPMQSTMISPGNISAMAQSTPLKTQGVDISAQNGATTGDNDTHSQTASGSATSLSCTQTAADAARTREQNRQITLLLAELDATKDINKKLSSRVEEAERDLEALKITQETQKLELEQAFSGKLAAMVEEIYAAQKQRDEAMMNRLRIANEERDVALLQIKHLENSLDHLNDNEELPLNLNVREVLSSLTADASTQDISDLGRYMVDSINTSLREQRQVATEEMRAVLEDRDLSVAKYKQMEADMLKQQRLNRAREADKDAHTTQQAKLLATQQERDMALARCQKLEDEMQDTLQEYYSLHKTLSQENHMRDQYVNSIESIEVQLRQKDGMVDVAKKENNRLAAQFHSVVNEKNRLVEELNKSQFAQKEAVANQEKMERLVNVLRRKINGLGTKTEE